MAGITKIHKAGKAENIFVDTPSYRVVANIKGTITRYSDEQLAWAHQNFLALKTGVEALGFLGDPEESTSLEFVQGPGTGRTMSLDSKMKNRNKYNWEGAAILSFHLQIGHVVNLGQGLAPNFELKANPRASVLNNGPDWFEFHGIAVPNALLAIQDFLDFTNEQFKEFGIEPTMKNVHRFLHLRSATYDEGFKVTSALKSSIATKQLLTYMAAGVDDRTLLTLRKLAEVLNGGDWPTVEEAKDLTELPEDIIKSLYGAHQQTSFTSGF